MSILRSIATLVFCLAALPSFALAAGGDHPWSDSLAAKTALAGPSLQEVLSTLGYSINVATDEVNATVFKPQASATSAEVTLKYRGSASLSNFGWYPRTTPAAKTLLIGANAPVGTMVSVPTESDSVGLYLGPTLFDDTWYTTKGLNWDGFKHARIFATGEVGHYVIAWEDLADGGDQDFEDAVYDLLFVNPNALHLSFVGQTDYLFCTEQEICFDVNVTGGIGQVTLQQEIGDNFLTIQSGLTPISYQSCFLPWPVDSVHRFVFKATDAENNTIVDTFAVTVNFRENPILTLTDDFVDTTICDLDSICIDVAEALDYDNDLLQFTLFDSPPASIDSATGKVCFLPTTADSALYQFIIVAFDSCCQSFGFPAEPGEILPCPRDTLYVIVRYQAKPIITTIPDTTIALCSTSSSQICFPVTAATENQPVPVNLECGPGAISDGQLCFNATSSGDYTFCFSVPDACGGFVRDTVHVNVIIDDLPPVANAGRDSTLSLCAPQPICWNAGCSGADLATCELVSPIGTFNGSQICFTPAATGIYTFVLRATDLCGNVDLDTAIVNVTVKQPPVALVADTTLKLCQPQSVCLPASCSDPDGDLTSCYLMSGPGTYTGSQICFTPDTSGTYRFVVRALDACGLADWDTGYAVVTVNRRPDVQPGGGSYVLCEPGLICVPINASDPDGNPLTFTTTMGTVQGNQVCINSGGPGTRLFNYQVIARDSCNRADTALYTVNVRVNMVPILTAPTPTPQKLCDPQQLCFNVTTVDSIITKLAYSLLSGPGTINPNTGQVCFTPTADGNYSWSIVVRDSCGKADTAQTTWNIDFTDPPTPVVVGPDRDTVVCLDSVVTNICVPISYNVIPNTTLYARSLDPAVAFNFESLSGSGTLCFDPLPNVDRTYTFAFIRKNECGDSTIAEWDFTIDWVDCDSSCVVLEIDKTECVNLGSNVTVNVSYEGRFPIGGFDMMFTYDVSAFSFLNASLGPAVNAWEYFTYRLGPFGNCTGSCPSGLVKVVAIADANNGAHHPPTAQLTPTGGIVRLTFRATSNATFEGQVYPVSFFWIDCGDNAFSTVSGDTLLIDKIIIDAYDVTIWDEDDDALFPEVNRYQHIGAPDSCLIGDKYEPLRCVELRNGYICIIDSDSIDARGDLNLNGIANEIADAVLYTNFFLRGIGVFNISLAAQVAASDINNDGITLTVGDLIYLLRIIVGDVQPIPKLSPFGNTAAFSVAAESGTTTIWSESTSDIGGVFLQARLPQGTTAAAVVSELAAAGLKLDYAVAGDQVNVLLYSDTQGARIAAGKAPILRINAPLEIEHLEAADYDGNMLRASFGKQILPEQFALGQNYPNPFNPTTTISFSLPRATDWTLTIVNVSGQVVKRFTGSSPAGEVSLTWDATDMNGLTAATGVYFYRLDAGEFSASRKMVLMK